MIAKVCAADKTSAPGRTGKMEPIGSMHDVECFRPASWDRFQDVEATQTAASTH